MNVGVIGIGFVIGLSIGRGLVRANDGPAAWAARANSRLLLLQVG